MRPSVFRYGAQRFLNRHCYRPYNNRYTEIKPDEDWQSALVKARFPRPTKTHSTLKFVVQRLHHSTLGHGVRINEESLDQHNECIDIELGSDNGLQGNQKQASLERVSGLSDTLIGPTSAEVFRQRTWDALQQRLAHELLPAILHMSQDLGYMKSLPSTTFIEILTILHPKDRIGNRKDIYRDLHPRMVEQLGTSQLHDIFAEYTFKIRELVRRRLRAGSALGIEEWKCLLQTVASVGDGVAALEIWTDMVNCKIEPDLACYNLYFEARCWSGAHLPLERHRLRVIPATLRLRRPHKPGSGHLQRLDSFQVGPGGLKDETTKMFAIMVDRGIVANEKTFCLLMIALSREGDLQGVKSILRRVWDVDVDSILEGNQDSREPTNLTRDSPLYPRPSILYAIAHIFGSNNELATALRIVDYVSRRYSIIIQTRVWDELLEWAHVLSRRRNAVRRHDGASSGQLPTQSVESLWNIMISAPYNIPPTMRMLDYYCRNLFKRQKLQPMLKQMRAGLALYRSQAAEYAALRRLHGITLAEQRDWVELSRIETPNEELVLATLTEYRNFLMVSRWFRFLLHGRRWARDLDRIIIWERQELPNAIREFWHFRTRPVIRYYISTCEVELAAVEDEEHLTQRSQPGVEESWFHKFNGKLKRRFLRLRKRHGSRQFRRLKSGIEQKGCPH